MDTKGIIVMLMTSVPILGWIKRGKLGYMDKKLMLLVILKSFIYFMCIVIDVFHLLIFKISVVLGNYLRT